MNRRTLPVLAGWTAAAALAVGAGIAALDVIGAGLTSAQSAPLTEAEVARKLRALPPAAPSPAVSASAGLGGAAAHTLTTRAGTVVVRCTGDDAEIVSMSPRDGYALHDRDGDEGEFRSTTDGGDHVTFDVDCTAGRPSLTLDDSGDD